MINDSFSAFAVYFFHAIDQMKLYRFCKHMDPVRCYVITAFANRLRKNGVLLLKFGARDIQRPRETPTAAYNPPCGLQLALFLFLTF